VYLEAQFGKRIRHLGRCAVPIKCQLGVGMKIAPKGDQRFDQFVYLRHIVRHRLPSSKPL
jgi:hypothetical protein